MTQSHFYQNSFRYQYRTKKTAFDAYFEMAEKYAIGQVTLSYHT